MCKKKAPLVAEPFHRLIPLDLSGDASGNAFDFCSDSVSSPSSSCEIRLPTLDLFTSFQSNDSYLAVRPANPQPSLCGTSKARLRRPTWLH
jgi:hypothetical protein